MSADLLELASRLRAIARHDGTIDAAQVRLIGLDEIRDGAGSLWPHMRERVRIGSVAILSRHAQLDDIIVPAGDGFLVIFASGSTAAIDKRCEAMRDALLAFYLGEHGLAALRPEVSARSLTREDLSHLVASTSRHGEKTLHSEPVAHVRDIACDCTGQ